MEMENRRKVVPWVSDLNSIGGRFGCTPRSFPAGPCQGGGKAVAAYKDHSQSLRQLLKRPRPTEAGLFKAGTGPRSTQ